MGKTTNKLDETKWVYKEVVNGLGQKILIVDLDATIEKMEKEILMKREQ